MKKLVLLSVLASFAMADCSIKIAKLERKLEIAQSYGNIGQIRGLENALANARAYCGGYKALVGKDDYRTRADYLGRADYPRVDYSALKAKIDELEDRYDMREDEIEDALDELNDRKHTMSKAEYKRQKAALKAKKRAIKAEYKQKKRELKQQMYR